jgi:hypothetical protein
VTNFVDTSIKVVAERTYSGSAAAAGVRLSG